MRRDHQGMGRAILFDIVSDLFLIELRDDDIFQTETERHMETGDDAVRGEHRDDVQEPLVSRVGDTAVFKRGGDRIEAVMAQHDALRHTGRTAGQRDRRAIVLTVSCRVGGVRIGIALLRERVPGDDVPFFFDLRSRHFELLDETDGFRKGGVGRDDDDLFEIHLLKVFFQFLIIEIDHHEDLCAGPFDEFSDLVGRQPRIEGHQSGAELVESVKGVDRLRERDGRTCDDIAFLDAEGGKRYRGVV